MRQALSKLTIKASAKPMLEENLLEIIGDEVNVKNVSFYGNSGMEGMEVDLDATLTPELKREGAARELTRNVNGLRKEAKLTIQDRVTLLTEGAGEFWRSVLDEYGTAILADVKADGMKEGLDGALIAGEVKAGEKTPRKVRGVFVARHRAFEIDETAGSRYSRRMFHQESFDIAWAIILERSMYGPHLRSLRSMRRAARRAHGR